MKSDKQMVLAFDVGTTTVAASLLNRTTGERLASAGRLNPQREFGADVVARLSAAINSDENLHKMSNLINRELESLAHELLVLAALGPADVSSIALAGNSVIEHLILGLPVRSLAFPPYRPLLASRQTLSTARLGWDLDLECTVFPMPGGYVGGDLVAFIFGVANDRQSGRPCLYLDLGTNGELAVAAGGRLFATSAAAGPAFEAGNLACGMAAQPGAISGVSLNGDRPDLTTIKGEKPIGICGSGVVATVSELLQKGVLDHSGRLLAPAEISSNLANHVQDVNGEPAFILYRDASDCIYLGQNDIRQFQLAKSAIRTGIEVLLHHAGLEESDLKDVILTGSFGAVLSPENLKNIGIFSGNMVENCRFVQEGALRGVESSILAGDNFAALDRLSEAIKVIPLSGTPAFEKLFFKHMSFPKQ